MAIEITNSRSLRSCVLTIGGERLVPLISGCVARSGWREVFFALEVTPTVRHSVSVRVLIGLGLAFPGVVIETASQAALATFFVFLLNLF